MPSQHGNGGQGGPWGSGSTPPDLEVLVRQGRERLGRLLPGGGSRGLIVLALFALAGLGAWTAYYTVPSDSVAVVQRFGKYLEEVPPGLHFKLPLTGIRVHDPRCQRSLPESSRRQPAKAGNRDGDGRPERRTG
jgi:membrane protease subunit HflK